MRVAEIQKGGVYSCRVSGQVVPVRGREHPPEIEDGLLACMVERSAGSDTNVVRAEELDDRPVHSGPAVSVAERTVGREPT